MAITRARREVYLSYPESREGRGEIRSQFLEEVDVPEVVCPPLDFGELIESSTRAFPSLEHLLSKEERYVHEFLTTKYRLSVSDLNTFLDDPRKFFERAVLRYPMEDSEAAMFGRAYHRALEVFFRQFKQTQSLPEVGLLVETFRASASRELLTPDRMESMIERGTLGLTGWYDRCAAAATIPVKIEHYPLNISLDGIPLTGKIDRIDLDPASHGLVLIDYKT